ncbi:MAG: cysteine hydrolase [Rudaea sp.]|uniref:cysteine hydrolase family protein n=1 Tax=unclassified Rudaea TaxID=2627037 RepID=UPI0010F835DC|nr:MULTISPECIES: cysteine hydrolase family protein [unclassified Rudaea]MBN8886316.1 cysteine hydrolase [Rudaea sp.]MBR0347896.1 cysteine hydrolase [Rudaea sp.]
MSTALLIIDIQRALCTGEEAAFDIERVVEKINALGADARAAGVPVVLVQHEEDTGALRFAGDGWQLAESLVTAPTDLRTRKTAPDSFHDTGLHAQLSSLGIDRLVVCGLQSDCCVEATSRGALALGYEVALAADAHSTVDSNGIAAAQLSARVNSALADLADAGQRIAVLPAEQIRIHA